MPDRHPRTVVRPAAVHCPIVVLRSGAHRISQDRRHESALLIDVTQIVERDFSRWATKLVCLDPKLSPRTARVLRRFGVSDDFEPSDLSAASALRLLKAMADEAADGS